MMHKNFWFEEMINNRNKSTVTDMEWSPDGKMVCIIYEDGAVIVGSVEGARLWGKEYIYNKKLILKCQILLNLFKHKLSLLCWSPDCKLIIFGTPEGEVRVYDCNGNPIHQLKMHCL